MSAEEKLFYYQKAAGLYEVVLDGQYAGFDDVPLISDYAEIAALSVWLGNVALAREYVVGLLLLISLIPAISCGCDRRHPQHPVSGDRHVLYHGLGGQVVYPRNRGGDCRTCGDRTCVSALSGDHPNAPEEDGT